MNTLAVMVRAPRGPKANILRRRGLIPAVVYGPGQPSASVQVERQAFLKVFAAAGETQLVELKLGSEAIPVLVHDYQRDPLSDQITHVDFLRVVMDKAIAAKVPLKFAGISPAAKDLGGVIVTNLREIEVKARPNQIPAFLAVDLSGLKHFHEEILVSTLALPAGVTLLTAANLAIISVLPPRTQSELDALSGTVEEKVEEVETVKREKAPAEGEAAEGEVAGAPAAAGKAEPAEKAKAGASPAKGAPVEKAKGAKA